MSKLLFFCAMERRATERRKTECRRLNLESLQSTSHHHIAEKNRISTYITL